MAIAAHTTRTYHFPTFSSSKAEDYFSSSHQPPTPQLHNLEAYNDIPLNRITLTQYLPPYTFQ
jgi:hypothetical protein